MKFGYEFAYNQEAKFNTHFQFDGSNRYHLYVAPSYDFANHIPKMILLQ